MEEYWWWTIAGIALVIAELITGTFYLLVLGIAAIAGAAVALYQYSIWIQAIIAAAVATIGVILVTRYRQAQHTVADVGLDVGQSVVLDSWIDKNERLARVRYRNALWDAKVLDEPGVEAGRMLYIRQIDGNTLHVSAHRA